MTDERLLEAAPEPAVTTIPGPERLLLHMPVDIRNMSLMVLAGLALLFVLHWAKAVFIPVMLSVLFSYALSPVVNWLEHKRVPRWLGAAVLVLGILGVMGSTTYALSNNAVQLLESLPVAVQKLRNSTKAKTGRPDSTLETVQKAATQIEQATQEGAKPAGNRGAMRVVVERSSFNIKDYLWTGTIGLMALIGQATVVIFLTYFLMLSGDTFRRKLVKLAGPSLSTKKVTLQALHEITGQIQRYLQVQLLTSALVGVLTWLALLAIGLENATVWGIAAGVLNLVPYVGSLITMVATALVGFLQFGTLNMAMVVGGASLVIHTIVGNLVTPWLTSRASRLSPVAVFVALLAWGWLWGVWGLLMGIPIMMIVKSVCDRVDDLKPLGEFLGS
ncbi:MAG: AI-2E family transporter [Polaromonas sp.]|uniref:AI-2E family transporter n=1 Tax=Polaromonas sp. TaxID=1869339 RepID=UPI00272FDBEA|nr:AI-2E family transporter [Polaromonas sp.]MDP1739620.1 AI-2E family transporter [Polaromonas sp.]MDP1955286.1 AI-2E family transporter [Polaromonas sp.]MDP3355610.1 AI-2E family transporter [Polaromonas sp.]MDP3751109.1 AI-2E family transporter [Polaromonas sp.]